MYTIVVIAQHPADDDVPAHEELVGVYGGDWSEAYARHVLDSRGFSLDGFGWSVASLRTRQVHTALIVPHRERRGVYPLDGAELASREYFTAEEFARFRREAFAPVRW